MNFQVPILNNTDLSLTNNKISENYIKKVEEYTKINKKNFETSRERCLEITLSVFGDKLKEIQTNISPEEVFNYKNICNYANEQYKEINNKLEDSSPEIKKDLFNSNNNNNYNKSNLKIKIAKDTFVKRGSGGIHFRSIYTY